MKTMKLLFTLLFVATFATVGLGQVGIENSLHDFSTTDWANGEICIACHTPHNGNPTAGAVLWNHDLTVTAFTVYDNTVSGTMDATVGQPSGSSKLCLSCHEKESVFKNREHAGQQKKDCMECHNPHGGDDRNILLK